MKLLLVFNPKCDMGADCARRALEFLRASGVDAAIGRNLFGEDCLDLEGVDILIAFGGDGTVLYTAKTAALYGVPVLGINLGHMGFLAGLSADNLEDGLTRLLNGHYKVMNHMMLQARVVREDACLWEGAALNDVVVSKREPMGAVELKANIDGEEAFHEVCDGIITAAPTGSTAYNLSAGGPIMEHTLKCITVTSICPHAFGPRSCVLAPEHQVAVGVLRCGSSGAQLSVDGRKQLLLRQGDLVEICHAKEQARLIRMKGYRFVQDLRWKMGR